MKLNINSDAQERLQDTQYADVLSVKEAGKILGICRISVYNLIETNQLEAFRIGRVYMIPKQAVKQFLLDRKNGSDER